MKNQTPISCHRPPGPRGLPIVGNTLQLAFDPLGFLQKCVAEYGEIVYLNVRGLPTYLIVAPDAIESVLVKHHSTFILDRLSKGLSEALGNSLLISEGKFWERQRRLVQPAFLKNRIDNYLSVMILFTKELMATWQDGHIIDVYHEMSRLMLRIITKTLIGYEETKDVVMVERFLDSAMHYILGIAKTGVRMPIYIPTLGSIAYLNARKILDERIFSLINTRRAAGRDEGDLLSMLLLARDGDGGTMTDQQIRDEILTMILVGHETNALALTYALWLLANFPDTLQCLKSEVDGVLQNKPLTAETLCQLQYTDWIFNESLRLFPPVWAMGREAIANCEVGGYEIPAKSQILISPWVCHRNPHYFNDPDRFVPTRWQNMENLPRYSYIPFGGGPRLCVGSHFARIEAMVILATLAHRYSFKVTQGQKLELMPTITLRPKGHVKLIVQKRC